MAFLRAGRFFGAGISASVVLDCSTACSARSASFLALDFLRVGRFLDVDTSSLVSELSSGVIFVGFRSALDSTFTSLDSGSCLRLARRERARCS